VSPRFGKKKQKTDLEDPATVTADAPTAPEPAAQESPVDDAAAQAGAADGSRADDVAAEESPADDVAAEAGAAKDAADGEEPARGWFGLPEPADAASSTDAPPASGSATAAVPSGPPAETPTSRSAARRAVEQAVEPPVDREPEPVPRPSTPQEAIRALADGRHQQPHDLLGHHLQEEGLLVRTYKPFATSVAVRFEDGERIDLLHESEGVWGGIRVGATQTMDYRLLVAYADGIEHELDDPYRFAPTLGPIDLHLIGEGRHEQLWTVLGAHVREYPGPMGTVVGTSFAVWAPRAQAVHVTGDFNGWDTRSHSMRLLDGSGVWELFVPGAGDGTLYKFLVRGADGKVREKADPMARATQQPPRRA